MGIHFMLVKELGGTSYSEWPVQHYVRIGSSALAGIVNTWNVVLYTLDVRMGISLIEPAPMMLD